MTKQQFGNLNYWRDLMNFWRESYNAWRSHLANANRRKCRYLKSHAMRFMNQSRSNLLQAMAKVRELVYAS